MKGQLLSKALAFIIELFKYVYVSTRENWDFSFLLRRKNVSDLEHMVFSSHFHFKIKAILCLQRMSGNCNRGPTLEVKYIFSSKGDWTNRSALALIKWSMKSSLKNKCNCTQLMLERQGRGASDFTCGCEQISQDLLVSVSQAVQWLWHLCVLGISKERWRNWCAKNSTFMCRKEAHKPYSMRNSPKEGMLNAGLKQ